MSGSLGGTPINKVVRTVLATYTSEEREKLDTALLDAFVLPALNMGKMARWQKSIVDGLLAGNTINIFSKGKRRTLKPMDPTITLGQLFKDLEPLLSRVMESFEKGTSAKAISLIYIHPVIEKLTENAGQELDELYVAYMCEAAYNQIGKK